jgi:predicted DNA-binding transcriptional regulator YafY
MSQTERLYKIDQMLNDRKVVSFQHLQEALGVSRATLKRDLEYMRSRLNAPIEWSREAGGYRFAQASEPQAGHAYALPGLWFNEQEIHALPRSWARLVHCRIGSSEMAAVCARPG